MTGYFSQLAQHTGLNFARDDPPAAGSADTAYAVVAPHADSVPPVPLHVDEITFSAPVTPGVYAGNAEGSAGLHDATSKTESAPADAHGRQTEASEVANSRRGATQPQTLSEAVSPAALTASAHHFNDAAASTQVSPPHYAAEQTHAGEQRPGQFANERSLVGLESRPQTAFAESETVTGQSALAAELSERHQAAAQFDAIDQALRVSARSDAALDERTERDAMARNYLKEIRDWVAATPEIDERAFAQQMEAQPENGAAFALEQAADVLSFAAANRPEELSVQDLNLSIGSIQIVIEEPQPPVPALPAAPPRVERAPAQTASEATRLSRYYLRAW